MTSKLNLGYACINMHLSETEKNTPARTCRKATFLEKGLPHVGMLFEQNIRNLTRILEWNAANGFTLYRMSSDMAPWCSEYALEDLPNWQTCKRLLEHAGAYARDTGQRLSFHPGAFTVLAGKNPATLKKSLHELEIHGKIMDTMKLPRNRYAKINIHLGGAYGDKDAAIARFIENYKKLSPAVTSRLTLENDDRPNLYTTRDLVEKVFPHTGIPVVFDYHHHSIHPGADDTKTALELAISTWGDVKPVTHYSETAQKDNPRKVLRAHSIMVDQYIDTYGHSIDCVVEAKGKERAVQQYHRLYGKDNTRSLNACA